MRVIAFTIPGEPRGKVRPKVGRTGAVFNHPANVFYEGLVREIAHAQMAGAEPLRGPLSVVLGIWKAPPASWSQTRRKAAMGAWMTAKPDSDNVAKMITDAMNGDKLGLGRVYADDAAVAHLEVTKRYGDIDCVDVIVRELLCQD